MATGDYGSVGSTAYATGVAHGDYSISAYNDYILNATGITAIEGESIAKFSLREQIYEVPDSAPPWTHTTFAYLFTDWNADEAGTSKDPKLVVVHGASAAGNRNLLLLLRR